MSRQWPGDEEFYGLLGVIKHSWDGSEFLPPLPAEGVKEIGAKLEQFAAITLTALSTSQKTSLVRLSYYYCSIIIIQVKQKQLDDPKIIFTSSDIEIRHEAKTR